MVTKNGVTLAKYIARNSNDFREHVNSLQSQVRKGSELHDIVNYSTFYGVLLSVARNYVAMFEDAGFEV